MALVDYSDSDSDSAVGAQNLDDHGCNLANGGLKRRRIGEISERPHLSDLPPLPAGFHDLYASASRASSGDDPSLHEGRQRLRPHVIGNWPTHVYLEWYPSYTESNQLSDLISSIKATSQSVQEIHSLLDSDLGTHLPLHISLSQPVVLVTQQRDTFAELFAQFIKQSGVPP
ncbi:MAG: poly(U)-specific 3'-to-5' RNA exonuclease, partial [Pleopsidium flavum]